MTTWRTPYSFTTHPPHPSPSQGYVLALTLFGIFFSLVLSYAFSTSVDGVFLHTRSDGKLFNLSQLRVKTKVRKMTLWEMLFADDTALASPSQELGLQRLMNCLAHVCREFDLTICLMQTKVMGQDVSKALSFPLETTPLKLLRSSHTSDKPSPAVGLSKLRWPSQLARWHPPWQDSPRGFWENNKLTTNTKILVYNACVPSILLCGSETWTAKTGTSPKQLPFTLLKMHSGHVMARPSTKHKGSLSVKHLQHVCVSVPATPAMTGPHSSYGGWTATKRRPLRRALHSLQTSWPILKTPGVSYCRKKFSKKILWICWKIYQEIKKTDFKIKKKHVSFVIKTCKILYKYTQFKWSHNMQLETN